MEILDRLIPRSLAALAALLLTTSAIVAHDVVELPKLLQNGVAQYNLGGEAFSTVMFRVVVPAGARNLRFDTGGGTGDCDLYVRYGAQPTHNEFDRASADLATREHVSIATPRAGPWYVKIDGARAFSGVTLLSTYQRAADAEAVPVLAPGPGSYSGLARVRMSAAIKGAVVRYTLDGTDPTELSPAYQLPLRLTASTELRARTFVGTTPRGPVLVAPYFVTPASEVIPLQNGVVVQHRAGLAGSNTLFKLTVPAGMRRLDVRTRGGTGRIAVVVRRGDGKGPGSQYYKRVGVANRTDFTIRLPAGGDWFVELRGRTDFAGCSVQASYRSLAPDLVVWPELLEPYLTTETFTNLDCEVQEGMIVAGTRQLIRFTTESRNIGGGNIVLGNPEGDPNFEFQECHSHYHFKGFASYTLRDSQGGIVAQGKKVSFCLEDVARWDSAGPAFARYDCENQGIQAGWSDIYDSGLPGQWIDITGVPPGNYQLEITVNPDRILPEADYTNNTTSVPVTITPAPPE